MVLCVCQLVASGLGVWGMLGWECSVVPVGMYSVLPVLLLITAVYVQCTITTFNCSLHCTVYAAVNSKST
jgi:hypothetical protein